MYRYRLLLLIIGPLTIWALFFLALYGMQAVGCEMGLQMKMWGGFNALRILVIALFLLATAVVIYFTKLMWQPNHLAGGMRRIMRYCALGSSFSIVAVFSGVFWLQMC